MEVAYGETLLLFSSFLSPSQGVPDGADCDYSSQPAFIGLPSVKEDDNINTLESQPYVISSPSSEYTSSVLPDLDALLAAEPAQYRTDLLRVSSFLQRLVPDRVLVHNDSVGERVLRRLEEGVEPKAFVAFDVHHVVRQWATFRALFEDVKVSIRAGATNRNVLAALIQVLGVSTSFESLADIASLRGSCHDAARLEAIHEEALDPEESFCHALEPHGCIDIALIRSSSRIRAALAAGVRLMCVGTISGIQAIARSARGSSTRRRGTSGSSSSSNKHVLPNLILSVRRSASTSSSLADADLTPGAALCGEDLLSFSAASIPRAVEAAFRVGMNVTGVRGSVDSLLDGSLELSLRYVVSSSHHEGNYTVVVDDLDTAVFGLVNSAAGVEQTCMSTTERNATLQRIRAAVRSLRAVLRSRSSPEEDSDCVSPCVQVVADASQFMLGACQTLTARVIGARPCVSEFGESLGRQFYIDDGIYGTLCRRATQVDAVHHSPAFMVGSNAVKSYVINDDKRPFDAVFDSLPCTVWGQTCDSIDKVLVAPGGLLPASLGLGDWLAFSCVTLQSQGTNTGFNGYDGPAMRYMVHIGF